MTGLNHAVTGVAVVVAINRPILALPVALLSHFAIDMLPHWGYHLVKDRLIRSSLMLLDLFLTLVLLALLAIILPVSPWLVIAGGMLAVSPDLMFLPYILWGRDSLANKKSWLYPIRRWHLNIQWSETAWGAVVEIAWFISILTLLTLVA